MRHGPSLTGRPVPGRSLLGRLLRGLPLLAAMGCAACAAGPGGYGGGTGGGPIQPQAVAGPCQVGTFFLLPYRSVPVRMQVAATGQPCTFTLLDPAYQIVVNAALVTGQPVHGRASVALAAGARQAAVSYVPNPGYVGPDEFRITLEPSAVGMTVSVTVQPAQ